MDLTIIELHGKITSCRQCKLGELLLTPLTPLTSKNTDCKILGVKLSVDIDCHLLEQNINTKEEIIFRRLLNVCGIDYEDFYLTSIIKCSGAESEKDISSCGNVCIKHLLNEVELLQPSKIFAFGRKTEKLLHKLCVDFDFTTINSLDAMFNSPKSFKESVKVIKEEIKYLDV